MQQKEILGRKQYKRMAGDSRLYGRANQNFFNKLLPSPRMQKLNLMIYRLEEALPRREAAEAGTDKARANL